jgi:molybdopterin-guanine dinucleotide biosynthesis protein A
VLAGGASSRMGQDKALLELDGVTILDRVAAEVLAACGSVTVIAPPERYGKLGLNVVPDLQPGEGPLGGILTALSVTVADWNLMVACDMPDINRIVLGELLQQAEAQDADCLLGINAAGRRQPLCAVYHRRCLPVIETAMQSGMRKVTAALEGLRVLEWQPLNADLFTNLNTPQEWSDHNA